MAHPPASARHTIRLLVGAALACLLVGLAAGVSLWREARWAPSVGDLVLGAGSPPVADLVRVAGVLRLDDILLIRRTGRGTEWIDGFVPFVPPGWAPGDPVPALLRLPRRERPPLIHTRLGPGGTFTSRPAHLRPGAARGDYANAARREGLTLASPILYVEEYVFDPYDLRFFFLLLGSGLCLGLLGIAGFVRWRDRRG